MDDPVGRLRSWFPPHQFDVIMGSLLGDARLECRSTGERYPVSARLRIQHGEKQRDYVLWKYEQLRNLVSVAPRHILASHDRRTRKDYYSWYFHTRTFKELGALYHYFYRDGVKILPPKVLEFVNPRVLAVWFMDDGSNTRESYTLNTHCFPREDQLKIVQFLDMQCGICARIVKDRTKFKIAIGRREYQKLNELIEPYVIPSMIYKICNPRNDLSDATIGQIAQAGLAL